MKIRISNSPNILYESALLIGKAISHNKGEKIKLLKEPEKYGLTELDLYERYGDFIEYSLDIYDSVKEKIEELELLHPYLSLNKFSNFLVEIVTHNEADRIEDFNFESFKVGALIALKNLEVMDGSKDLDQLHQEVKEFSSSSVNLGKILNMLDNMVMDDADLEPKDKVIFLNFFNNLEEIYPVYKELLEYSHGVYMDNYIKVEKYVKEGLDKLKTKGEYPSSAKELEIAKYIDIESVREKDDDILYYYISTILYNGMSITVSTNDRIPIVAMEGILFRELSDFKEEEVLKFGNIREQLKALGDSTRFNIINLLKDRPYYLKELADSLELTSPTVSHHMDELVQAGLVKITTKGRRIYYSLKFESIKSISEYFHRFQEVEYEKY